MLKEKLKSLIPKKSENNKKNIENLVFFLILLIITIFSVKTIWGNKEQNSKEEDKSDYAKLAQAFEPNSSSNINGEGEYVIDQVPRVGEYVKEGSFIMIQLGEINEN